MFIQGANILVDNKGCIKLADFGASKRVVELVLLAVQILISVTYLFYLLIYVKLHILYLDAGYNEWCKVNEGNSLLDGS